MWRCQNCNSRNWDTDALCHKCKSAIGREVTVIKPTMPQSVRRPAKSRSIWTRDVEFGRTGTYILCAIGLTLVLGPIISFVWYVSEDLAAKKPIHTAAAKGDLVEVKKLVEAGTPVDLKGTHGYTPVYLAFESNHMEVVNYLLEKGANINIISDEVIRRRDPEVVKFFTGHGGRFSDDALVQAIAEGAISGSNTNIADQMLKAGAYINCIFNASGHDAYKGGTALHIAVVRRDFPLVKYLVNRRADVNAEIASDSGRLFPLGCKTPLRLAEASYKRFQDSTPGAPGIHYYTVVPPSEEIAAFLRQHAAR